MVGNWRGGHSGCIAVDFTSWGAVAVFLFIFKNIPINIVC